MGSIYNHRFDLLIKEEPTRRVTMMSKTTSASSGVASSRLVAFLTLLMAGKVAKSAASFVAFHQSGTSHGGPSTMVSHGAAFLSPRRSSTSGSTAATDATPSPAKTLLRLSSSVDQVAQNAAASTSDDADDESSSATKYSGSGPVQVDMNVYNLDLDKIAEEWTATLQPRTDFLEEGVFLGAKSKKEIMVDTLKLVFKRLPNQGLGIELLELAGGREDGLGITIVSGVVDGGPACNCGLVPGDSIAKVAIRKRSNENTDSNEIEEIASVTTECLGYDATVEAIGSLPPAPSEEDDEEEVVVLTVKRLRRKPKVLINFQYPPDQGEKDITIELFAGENLRRAMLVRGVKLNDPLARRFDNGGSGDCGAEGTCATCTVSITNGMDLLNEPGLTEQQIFKDKLRYRMACKAVVGYGMKEGEMTIRVNPRQWYDKE